MARIRPRACGRGRRSSRACPHHADGRGGQRQKRGAADRDECLGRRRFQGVELILGRPRSALTENPQMKPTRLLKALGLPASIVLVTMLIGCEASTANISSVGLGTGYANGKATNETSTFQPG